MTGAPRPAGAAGLYYVAVLGAVLFAARWGILVCCVVAAGSWAAGSRWGSRWLGVGAAGAGGAAVLGCAGAGVGIW